MSFAIEAGPIRGAPDPQTYPNGRFAFTTDPEGNPIELWEPAPGSLRPHRQD